MSAPTVLLDTNVWNYIIDENGVEPLRKMAKASGIQVVACPAVVFECLRVPDPDKRRRRAKALTREDWLRVMPEAFSGAEDLRFELGRLRQAWFLEAPDLRQWYRHRADWQSGFWWRVRHSSREMARVIGSLGDSDLQQARVEAKFARKEAESLGHTLHKFKWNNATATFAEPTPGWDGNAFEAWRAASVAWWWDKLVHGRSGPAVDWLGPWLDLRAIGADPASWAQLWTREVETHALPREWVRWAMAEAQATRSTSPGTPGDNQLATYLIDVDMFVSTDKVFVELVDAMRPHCPVPLAEVRRSPAGVESLTFLLSLLEDIA
ncbi:hypothetical protein G1H11_16290 [Phytoactinopolyspora alkaliphila]|uniref:PIN domain-containing protein n=1 Tax=Phytoactinopolyspora alkaliphila TaxID=1783498 RepID=A0A6N9YPI8_9ACTN|nr:hypothetical protein [Phytoactinopolyspora alkaliphila]NED96867.1 hypothetical protein [Phytoactinopolyspora alkaliphila]